MTVLGDARIGFARQTRWQATVVHAGILASLFAGLASLWMVLALVVALLAHPASTMSTLEREGTRGLLTVVRHGTASVVTVLRRGSVAGSIR